MDHLGEEGRRGQDPQSEHGQRPLHVGGTRRHVGHRAVQRRRAPEQVEHGPAELELAGVVVDDALDRDEAVDPVGREDGRRRRRDEIERSGASATSHDQAHDPGEQRQVEQRIGHPDDLLVERRVGGTGEWREEEHP